MALTLAWTGASGQSVVSLRKAWHKPPRLYEEVARDLAEAITGGRYEPTTYLPTEQALVEEYGASRNVVREALKLLSARGLVEVLHGRGTRVLPRQQWQMVDQLVSLMRDDAQIPRDLLELRRILEAEIAALAAERATAEQVEAMRATVDAMRRAAGHPEVCIEEDISFHRLLAEAAGNVLLPMVLDPVTQLLRASRLATIQNPGSIARSVKAHRAILNEVAARSPAGARQAMQRHLVSVEGEIARIKDAPDAS